MADSSTQSGSLAERGTLTGGRVDIALRSTTRTAPAGRGSGYTTAEVESLLELLETHEPIGGSEWERVQRIHNGRFPASNRTADSLRRKFADLYRKRAPTGDPTVPPHVIRAKSIREKISARADITDVDGVTDFGDAHEGQQVNATLGTPEVTANIPPPMTLSPSTDDGSSVRLPSPRPFIRKRDQFRNNSNSSELMDIIKMQLLQDAARREEEREIRNREREDEKERRAAAVILEKERREAEAKRHDEFLKIMMLALSKKSKE